MEATTGPTTDGARLIVVFILSTRRAGSTWLNAVLGSQSWAVNLGEYFRPFLIPGHVACRLCQADGLTACTALHGIDNVPADEAFTFAGERFGRRVVIDASKRLDWCARFTGRADLDVRLIHLVRHPCGYVESEERRPDVNGNSSRPELLEEWERVNRAIDAFVAETGRPNILACYDDLADHPNDHFPSMCAWLGRTWEPAGLEYWKFAHHGLGGNGAASLYLRGRSIVKYKTGDDSFYDQLLERGTTASDRRWRDRMPAEFHRRAIRSPYALSLAHRLGRDAWPASS